MILRLPSWEPPPDAPSILEFARSMTVPDGPYKGDPFDPTIEAPQKILCEVMDGKICAPDGSKYKDIVTAWCTQGGKSLSTILCPALHAIVGQRESCVYCLPTADLLNKTWEGKLKPAIESCGFKDWLPEKGAGSRGGKPSLLPLYDPITKQRAGNIIFIAGGSGKKREAGQASVTAAVILIDEADEYEDAHRIQLVRQRGAAFGADALSIVTSTVKKDNGSVILGLVVDSTNSRVHFGCPHCGRHQLLTWDRVSYDASDDLSAAESVRYACLHCPALLTERDRKVMLGDYRLVHGGQHVDADGEICGPVPRSKTFGLLCGKLDFCLGMGLPELAIEHRKAQRAIDQQRDHGLMRSFQRDRMSTGYTADRDELPEVISNKYLAIKSKRSTWAKRSVPSWAKQIFLAVDVQHDRVYWAVIAVTDGMRWAPVDWGYEYGDNPQKQVATDEIRHQQLDIVRDRAQAGWTIYGTDETMLPTYNCVDVGYATDCVNKWINAQPRGWVAVRGYGEGEDEKSSKAGTKKTDLQGWGELRYLTDRRERWLFCESQTVVRWMHDSLMRESGHEGSGEIPRDSTGEAMRPNDVLLLHITQNVWDFDQEKSKWFWRKVHAGRRDLRDCLKYALTLAKFHLTDAKRHQARSAPKGKGLKKVGTINARKPPKSPAKRH